MNLEDHLGDIIRKARLMSDTSAAVAANAAGLTEAELAALEATGSFCGQPDWATLADAVGLDAAKLENIADGWLPAPRPLNVWRQLRSFTSADEELSVNCYLAWDEATREAALFDTGFDAAVIRDTLTVQRLQLRHIFITHTHPDHIAVLGAVRAAAPQARVHSNSRSAPADQRNQPGTTVSVGRLRITHCETPGHAADGVTYLIGNWPDNAPLVAVVGDAIFAGSMGRGNDSWEIARDKVREHILGLPPETLLCPGHGPLTTVGEELRNNPFF